MSEDTELLRQFAHEGSQAAFAELVRRHLDLVYGAALRRTGGSASLAADVSQDVFIRLARRAGSLVNHPALGAWLHTASRNAALNTTISEKRRRDRERIASTIPSDPVPANWEAVRPLLDDAIDRLPQRDRTAVVLRFLERKPFAEIAAVLQVSEDAARMRTDRALDKLRAELSRRGIASTAGALALLLNTETVVAAPIGLAGTIIPIAIASAASAPGLVAYLAAFMTPKVFVTVAAVAAAFFAGTRVHSTASLPVASSAPVSASEVATISALRSENERLKSELAHASQAPSPSATAAPGAPAAQKSTPLSAREAELLKRVHLEQERRIMSHLRQLASACGQYFKEKQHAPVGLEEIIGEGANKYIRRLDPVDGEDYATLPLGPHQVLSVTMKDGTIVTYDPAGQLTTDIPAPTVDIPQMARSLGIEPASLERAWYAYLAAHEQSPPKTPLELVPYFATIGEAAAYSEALDRLAGQKSPP